MLSNFSDNLVIYEQLGAGFKACFQLFYVIKAVV